MARPGCSSSSNAPVRSQAAKQRTGAAQLPPSSAASAAGQAHPPLVMNDDQKQVTLQHLFLQSFFSRPSVLYAVAQELYLQLASDVLHVADAKVLPFPSFLDNVNQQLFDTFSLQLMQSQLQNDGKLLLTMIDTEADPSLQQLTTSYSPQEMAYLHLIIRKVLCAPERIFARSLNDCLRASNDKSMVPALSKMAAQRLVTSFVAKGWFRISPSRLITLSARCMVQLAPYLNEEYGDFEDSDSEEEEGGEKKEKEKIPLIERVWVLCEGCAKGVTVGWACPNEQCDLRFHRHCANVAIRGQDPKCTSCGEKWTYDPATKAVQGFRLGPSDAQLGSSAAASDDDDEDVAVAMLKGRRTQLHSEEEEEVDQLDD